jgi:hypothetical protein
LQGRSKGIQGNSENDCASSRIFDNVAPPQDASLGLSSNALTELLPAFFPPGSRKVIDNVSSMYWPHVGVLAGERKFLQLRSSR